MLASSMRVPHVYWSLVTGHWSLVTGHWSLVTGHWSLVTGHWSLVTGHWSLVPEPACAASVLHSLSVRSIARSAGGAA
ncbi:hypothetical protein FDP22_09350 [Paroceanicella profunda]|uniref:Uncharacterized protein n=1 Tax=Paroceanicella profunda TaxID=2579971 RepID=A0A5B8FZB3_9RHOB|nr:hypothetical protein FDP22_09350 [Paroceanicella profunda]